ncbi:MAG: hypothetical protein K6C94_09225 [Candidatus Gastranaerophilales bacterium]|nr:hypothetical protein [Candidatus Gastranaerophilales bacterium]
MGLASSQARMLLLTARKSDLEYRAQMISQRKIDLSMQTEEIATRYSQATSNRKMYLVNGVILGEDESSKEKLSYAGLMATNNDATTGNFLVRLASNGKYLVTGESADVQMQYAMKIMERLARTEEGGLEAYTDENGSIDYNALYNKYANRMYFDGYSTKSGEVESPAFTNADLFQEAIRNGSLYLYKADVPSGQTTDSALRVEFKNTAWSSISSIQDKYYTEDDPAAKADYEAKTLTLSNQDKMLDLELNKIQTQHKAIETEYDSVKKVIEKNIEVSYKIFA